ncbi:MAG: undecaprenyl-diphosphate phosphatase [Coriobacteriales bacterium]|jgi:undecaprenyl-diphosphatase|nr:undecaprenyl-diphosphate phosphatase [Coriobacteriales bacterium]
MDLFELLKALLIGIVEGVTEWLPISSTGHMILFDEFVTLKVSPEFLTMFLVVIQLGAIMAVIMLYFHKLNPFSPRKDAGERRATLGLWAKVVVGCIPAAVIGFLLDSWVGEHFYTAVVVACALIVYGVAFIVVERLKGGGGAVQGGVGQVLGRRSGSYGGRHARHASDVRSSYTAQTLVAADELDRLSFARALGIGAFQCLAIIPGTSRSGSTILGGLILGVPRQVATEFSFFLAIPVMFGWSLLKVVKAFFEGLSMTGTEWGVLAVGTVVSFFVSVVAIRFLIGYIKGHSFAVFGWYRIVLGIVVLIFFAATGSLFM